MSNTGVDLVGYSGAVAARSAHGGIVPGDDGAIGLERRKGIVSGEDLNDPRAEQFGHINAAATQVAHSGTTPADNGAIGFERRKGHASGEDLNNTGAELIGYSAAVAAKGGVPPSDDRTIGLDYREGS